MITPSGFPALNSSYAEITCQTPGYWNDDDDDDDDGDDHDNDDNDHDHDDTDIDDENDDVDLLFREAALGTEHLYNVPAIED